MRASDRDSRSWGSALTWTGIIQIALLAGVTWWRVELPIVPPVREEVLVALDLRQGESLRGDLEDLPEPAEKPEPIVQTPEPDRPEPEPRPEPQPLPERVPEPESAEDPVPVAGLPVPRPLPRVVAPVALPIANEMAEPDALPLVPGRSAAIPEALAGLLRPPDPGPSGSTRRPTRIGRAPSIRLPDLPEAETAVASRDPQPAFLLEGPAAHRRIVSRVIPRFPPGVRRSGRVRLRFVVRPDGIVGDIVPEVRIDPVFEEAAIRALREWRFEPEAERRDRGAVTFVFELIREG
ncbi:MAG: hypothetical protein CME06_12465 [Gemmatimonadetes bacterium]|nr:hypothetical protein [Gemmatimonadota bacterium]